MKKLLHVGCGPSDINCIDMIEDKENWEETRLDVDHTVNPDYLCSMVNMYHVPKEEFDMVFSSHNLEHVYSHEVIQVLWQFERVLKPGGLAVIIVPNIEAIAKFIVDKGFLDVAYTTNDGNNLEIRPIDMLFGWVGGVAAGKEGMQHKTAFSKDSLAMALSHVGFDEINVSVDEHFNLYAVARKRGERIE